MEISPNNPSTNQLGPELTEADLSDAILNSDYPLQTSAANLIRQQLASLGRPFHVQEEWSYIDGDTHDLKTIAILAQQLLWDFPKQPRVRPALDLLIECKQSALPYVFFLSPSKPWADYFPLFAGLPKDTLVLETDDEASTTEMGIVSALGLASHPFLIGAPEYCVLSAKCVWRKSGIELSSTESFHELVVPILKAMDHFRLTKLPPSTFFYFDCHLVIGIALVDGPMVGVRISGQSHRLALLPWVRVLRHETDQIPDLQGTKRGLFAVDVVHKDFLQEYLSKHVLPFAESFSRLAVKHQQELASGEGFATGMGKNWADHIEERLEPRRVKRRAQRTWLITRNIFRFLTHRLPQKSRWDN